jgi:hypothetical protein
MITVFFISLTVCRFSQKRAMQIEWNLPRRYFWLEGFIDCDSFFCPDLSVAWIMLKIEWIGSQNTVAEKRLRQISPTGV